MYRFSLRPVFNQENNIYLTKVSRFVTVDGGWADWSRWETCSTSCGPGTTKRARKCSNPPPQNGGKTCSGNNTETNQCTLRACPGISLFIVDIN